MKLYLIAGENSGDFIGSCLIKSIRSLRNQDDPKIEFNGVGGSKMKEEGVDSLFAIEHINIMGFFEVLPHLFRINKLINQTVEDILSQNPDIVVTIDSPGFTYRVAERVREIAPHIKLVHIVAPSVWAYKPGRAKKYAKLYDHLLTLLPFEPEYFVVEGLKSTCIGHPVLEQVFLKNSSKLRNEMNITGNSQVIAVTPGSRKGEIRRHMPVIRKIFDKLATTHNVEVIFVQPNEINIQEILKFLSGAGFNYSFLIDRLKAFAVSDCALAKSGTNTLEIAASGTPQIVGYKLNPITFFLLKMMIKVRFASLINIISDREIIPEYIQSEFNEENLVHAISGLLNDKKGSKSQVAEAQRILKNIGLNDGKKPSERAAKVIIDMLK
jgi:lipid-A-disaccharide synthase